MRALFLASELIEAVDAFGNKPVVISIYDEEEDECYQYEVEDLLFDEDDGTMELTAKEYVEDEEHESTEG